VKQLLVLGHAGALGLQPLSFVRAEHHDDEIARAMVELVVEMVVEDVVAHLLRGGVDDAEVVDNSSRRPFERDAEQPDATTRAQLDPLRTLGDLRGGERGLLVIGGGGDVCDDRAVGGDIEAATVRLCEVVNVDRAHGLRGRHEANHAVSLRGATEPE